MDVGSSHQGRLAHISRPSGTTSSPGRGGISQCDHPRARVAMTRSAPGRRRRPCPGSGVGLSPPVARSSPTAIGRSRPAPPLRRPRRRQVDGDPAQRPGQTAREDGGPDHGHTIAPRQRPGRPTMVKPGRPLETWTSTETGRPTAPLSVAEATEASATENRRCARSDFLSGMLISAVYETFRNPP